MSTITLPQHPQQNVVLDEGGRVSLPWGQWFRTLRQIVSMVIVGTGDPTNVVTATQGSLFLRLDGGAGSTLYVLEGPTAADWAAK